jgi:hypothetical protein
LCTAEGSTTGATSHAFRKMHWSFRSAHYARISDISLQKVYYKTNVLLQSYIFPLTIKHISSDNKTYFL